MRFEHEHMCSAACRRMALAMYNAFRGNFHAPLADYPQWNDLAPHLRAAWCAAAMMATSEVFGLVTSQMARGS